MAIWTIIGRIVLISLASLVGLVAVMAGILLILSPGNPKPFTDANGSHLAGSISEKVYVPINGIEQGMFIKGKDATNPVLLYVHGGMPDYFLTERYPTGLEEYFTVCWWEQRGSGLSARAGSRAKPVTAEQLVSDTIEVTNYLRNRFGEDKIYLMGHSGGTFVGIQAASRAPELYSAYLGVAQMADQLKSERLAYDYLLAGFRRNGDTQMVSKLEAAPVTMEGGTPKAYLAIRDVAMHRLGVGTTHAMRSVTRGIFLQSLQFSEYTLREKINLWRAKAASGASVLWGTMISTSMVHQVPELDLPVYFFEGVYDYTCSYTEAKAYFDKLKAPLKGFYTFNNSAHSPMLEEPAKMQKILREDVLTGTNHLADPT
ncbi:MAG TPA: alpha/beta hydrolase [Spirochaetia bacterium]|nr:alpha/beta hydrolase [Spirochaetia bacterium]